jgi:methylase of polypeptide subunit release factors
MLTLLSPEKSKRLLDCFAESDYAEANVKKQLGAAELPSRRLRNLARLKHRTSEPSILNVLLRWFWLGLPQNRAEIVDLVPGEFLDLLLESGLIVANGERLAATAMMLPEDGFLVASDHPAAFEQHKAELVLWPNPTSKFLSKFAVRRHSRATLDLGTGCGILSLSAARHSDIVIATDLNQRAVQYTQFNARLNGIDNIEALVGDCFAPVEGRRFDLILSNPPFFITPQSDYLFCDNPMDLDGLCRRLVKEAPGYMNEGAYMEMLCEWAQVSDQSWSERISEWLEGSDCDAWVMKGWTENPAEYAQRRISEIAQDSSGDAELYQGYMNYYKQRNVVAIHDGLIVMRRRTGDNWVKIEEVPKITAVDLGKVILSTFAAMDFLAIAEDDDQLAAARPKLSPNVRLEQFCSQVDGRWHAEAVTLRLTSGFPFHITVQPLVAEFLATCDGTQTAEEAIQKFTARVEAPAEVVRRECLNMIRKLIERGLIEVDTQ